ncbi:MAG: chemotaxis protein CheX [Pseudomonadales bacterium]
MLNKFFGQFLLEKGLITPEQLLTAISLQKASNPSLGKIAVDKGMLSEAQAEAINAEQQRTDQRFGDLAVTMQLLSDAQVGELIDTQKAGRKFFGQILIEEDFLNAAAVEEELTAHAAIKEKVAMQVDSQIEQHKYAGIILNTLDSCIKLFTRIAKINAQVAGIGDAETSLDDECLYFSQCFERDQHVKIGLVLPKRMMQELALNFLKMDVSDHPAVYQDAVCEFLNIVLGNALAEGEQQTKLEPPQINDADADNLSPFAHALYIQMTAGEQSFKLFIMND